MSFYGDIEMSWMGDESYGASQLNLQKQFENEWKPKMFHKPVHKQTLNDYIQQVQREEARRYVQPQTFEQWMDNKVDFGHKKLSNWELYNQREVEAAREAYEAGRLTGMAQEHALQQMANTGGDYL